MDMDCFQKLATNFGFACRPEPGNAVVVPPGFAMLEVTIAEESHGLRWTLYGSLSLARLSKTMLQTQMRLSQHPASEWGKLLGVLDERVDLLEQ